jgi:hypothetical protein
VPGDFEPLPDFDEITRNILLNVNLKKEANKYKLTIIDYETNEVQDDNALLLINSVPVFQFGAIAPLNTSSIQKIELKKRCIVYGSLHFHGVLSISTTDKLAKSIYTDQAIPSFQNSVMKSKHSITKNKTEALEAKNKQIPDFRQNLYWNPELELDRTGTANVEFNTSDYKGKYIIQVQGISADQTPIHASYTIEVK